MLPPLTRRIGLLNVCATTQDDAVERVARSVACSSADIFAFCNAHTVNTGYSSAEFVSAVDQATLFNDGVGVDLAGKILYGQSFPANLNGTDLTPRILDGLPPGTRIFLVGSAPGVALIAQQMLSALHPKLRFVGAEDGFFSMDAEPELAHKIVATGAQLVLIGMGQPRQELWAARNRNSIGAVLLCVGAFLDFTAGEVRRAPSWIRRFRLEWVFRLAHEPRRLMRRYLIGNAAFVLRILRQRLNSKSPYQA